jgi:hypothetical protein
MTSFSLTARMKYELTQTSKESISEKYEEVKESKEPHVIIYSSCWSYYSQITQIMRSCGLLSAIALKKDRGEITKGQVYQLNDDQKETLDTVTKEEKKDVILSGKHTSLHSMLRQDLNKK